MGRRILQWFVHFLVNNIFILLTMSFLSPSYIGPFVLRHFVGLVLLLRPLHAHLTPISLLTSCTPPRYLILLSYPVRFSLSYPVRYYSCYLIVRMHLTHLDASIGWCACMACVNWVHPTGMDASIGWWSTDRDASNLLKLLRR